MIEIEIEIYETANGKKPFKEWVDDLRESLTQAKVWTRIDRLKMGNFGDCKTLQDGVCELRIDYGPGLRIYYGKIGTKLILLLCGGRQKLAREEHRKSKGVLSRLGKKGQKLWQEVENITII